MLRVWVAIGLADLRLLGGNVAAPESRKLPAPRCFYCTKRIGYNQKETAVRNSKGVFLGWAHQRCQKSQKT